jgi:uncharacterized protein (TIGR02594 family)
MKAFVLRLFEVIAELLKPKHQPAPKPAPKPTPATTRPITAKAWMDWAHHEATDGIAEEPNKDNRGPVIDRYIRLGRCGAPGQPYCAVVVNAALEQAGVPGSRSAMARSFESNPNFIKLPGPAWGAITTFWRNSKTAGLGHVGFYIGETEHHIYTLGGNQGDDFNESPFPKSGQSFGHVGYYWPKTVPLPPIKKIALDGHGRPTNLKVT